MAFRLKNKMGIRPTGLSWLLVLALVFHGLMPLGFMPGTSAHGGHSIVICSGYGPKQIVVDDTGRVVPQNENKAPAGKTAHQGNPCIFALNGLHTPPVFHLAAVTPPQNSSGKIFSLHDFKLARQWAFGNAAARSPPYGV